MTRSGGRAPFGFRWEGDELVIVEREAEIRRRAFELFLELERKDPVANQLNSENMPSPGGSKWSGVAVRRTLSCESAIGRYVTGKTRSEGGKRVKVPEEQWLVLSCPRIVDDQVWERTQHLLNGGKPGRPVSRPPLHLFSGLAICECGQPMRVPGKSGKYVCPDCKNKIPIDELERAFETQLKEVVLPLMIQAATPPADAAETAQAEVREQMRTLEELFAKKAITLQRFSERQTQLEQELEDAKTSPVPQADAKPPFDLEAFLSRWPTFPFPERLKLVRLWIAEATVRRDDVEFSFRIPESLKDTPTTRHTTKPTHDPVTPLLRPDDPRYIRLPKGGTLCAYSGLSRSALNDLVLQNKRNSFKPPVKSRKVGGARLIDLASLMAHVERSGD